RHDNNYEGRMVTVMLQGETLEVTENHPFWVLDGDELERRRSPAHLDAGADEGASIKGKWIDSHELKPGDSLYDRNGTLRKVESVTVQAVTSTPVYNLTVENQHTFAVGEFGLLTHNDAWCKLLESTPGMAQIRAKLAKKLDVPIEKIHGHHIVQKTRPQQWDK